MEEIKDDNWADWLVDDKHRWENINKVKLPRKILGSFFLLLIYLVIALISYGVSVVLLSYVEIGKLGCNTILPFTLSSTDCQYLTAGSVLVLSIVTVMCKSWKESVTDKYVVFSISTFVYFLLIPVMIGFLTFAVCYTNGCFGKDRMVQRQAVVKAYLGISSRYYRRSFYRIVFPGTNEELVFRMRWNLNCPMGTPCTLYTHKGCFGLYVADSLTVSNDRTSETVIAQ